VEAAVSKKALAITAAQILLPRSFPSDEINRDSEQVQRDIICVSA